MILRCPFCERLTLAPHMTTCHLNPDAPGLGQSDRDRHLHDVVRADLAAGRHPDEIAEVWGLDLAEVTAFAADRAA